MIKDCIDYPRRCDARQFHGDDIPQASNDHDGTVVITQWNFGVEFRGVEKGISYFVVPGWYKSQMVNLASKGKVRIELMVTGGRECYCYKCSWNRTAILGWLR
nr:hypothetical protein CFP56_78081 [Quercus suber]